MSKDLTLLESPSSVSPVQNEEDVKFDDELTFYFRLFEHPLVSLKLGLKLRVVGMYGP